MKKRVLALLVAVLTLVSSYAVFTVVTGASSPAPELNLDYANLSFSDSVYIMYALDTNVADAKLLVWTSPEAEYVIGTQDSQLTPYDGIVEGESYKIFNYPILAKQMADVIYVRAYARVDNVDYYSDVVKYSALQYAYNKLGKTAAGTDDAELKTLLTKMLDYGAAAQLYFDDYKADRLANANWYQVVLTAGVLDDGFAHGLYLPGDKVTLTAPATDANGTAFGYWADSTGASVATTAVCEITVGSKNETYTPVYGESAEQYSEGLEFEANKDGTCCIIGAGSFTGTKLLIPPTSPDGKPVSSIDSSVFAGNTDITFVKFPATIVEIGRNAFNGCTSITEVEFDGTEEEWANIDIKANNDPIENAAKTFKASAEPDIPENIYTKPTIAVGKANSSAGETVTVKAYLYNNPGIVALTMFLDFDDSALELIEIARGTALSEMTCLLPEGAAVKKGCNLSWDAEKVLPEDATNGIILEFTFKVKNTVSAGNYDVSFVLHDVKDNDLKDIDLDIISGSVIVE